MPLTQHSRDHIGGTLAPTPTPEARRRARWIGALIGVVVALWVMHGVGLGYLALMLRRSSEGILQAQAALLQRLEEVQRRASNVAEEQETLRLLIADQQRRVTEMEVDQRRWAAELESVRGRVEDRLASLEATVHGVQASHREFSLLLSSAQESWVALTRDLMEYQSQMRQAIEAVERSRDVAADGADRRAAPSPTSGIRLPRGVTALGAGSPR